MSYDGHPDDQSIPPTSCSHGHPSSLCLHTQEGGIICLLCFSNLISDPLSSTVHVSYALSQFSQALSQPAVLRTFLTFHSHFIVAPFVAALCSFDDHSIARQLTDLVRHLCDVTEVDGHGSLCDDFIARFSDRLSSGSLAWSRRQLHCYGMLLNYRTKNFHGKIKNNNDIVSNLVAGLELPSEEIRGEILFVLYKLSVIEYASNHSTETDVLSAFCPKLLYLSLEALMKTQNDDVRLNCVALLTVLVQRGLLGSEPEYYSKFNEKEPDELPLNILFADAIKGPLLSSDIELQLSTLELIIRYLSSEGTSITPIQLLVEENIVDYIFEILRFSEGKDPLARACLQALDLLSKAELPFNQRLAVGFATLIPVLRHVAEVPFHPVHSQTLGLILKCISQCPGVVAASHIEELVLTLTRMLRQNVTGKMGIHPDTFATTCGILVTIMKSPSHRVPHLATSIQEVLEHVVLFCLRTLETQPSQLLHSLYLLKEFYAYSQVITVVDDSVTKDMKICVLDVCTTHLLPWLLATISTVEEELVMGVLETFNSILLEDPDIRTIDFAKTLLSSCWFSFSFKCLGSFPSEKMKWRVYLMLSSLVDVIFGNDSGQCIREAVSFLPSDPVDLLFLLGQKSFNDLELSSCHSVVLLLLHASSLHDDRLADEKMVLASLEQYILVSKSGLLCGNHDPFTITQLVNIYGFCRSVADASCHTSYSSEVESILFQLVTESEWDMHSSRIHRSTLLWLFKQEKMRNPLSYQVLKICQILDPNWASTTTVHNQFIGAQEIAELIAEGENYAATILIFLLEQLVEEGVEHHIILVVNFVSNIVNMFPSCADQLHVHGIGNAIKLIFYNTKNLYSKQTFKAVLLLVFSVLKSGHSGMLSNDEAWLAVTVKLLDWIFPTEVTDRWTPESLLVVAILSLILHLSTDGRLIEASKSVLFHTPMASATKSILHEACSKGPALIDEHEGTNMGKTIILVLFLVYFSMRSLQAVLPGAVDWQNNLGQSNGTRLSFICISCHDLCRLLHFGSTSIKLMASYCLFELFTQLSDQRTSKQEELKCNTNYLRSVITTLEGLVVYGNQRVATNCSLCLSMVLGWKEMEMLEARVTVKNKWCRFIVEELVASISRPCLVSNTFTEERPSIYVAVALLKLQKDFGWMRSIFHEACISRIIENVTISNLSPELVTLFRELLNSEFMLADHISNLNLALQTCRKHIYYEKDEDTQTEREIGNVFANVDDDLGEVCEYLNHLIQSYSQKNKRLLKEIEMFFTALAEKETS
ncbi:protein PRD1 isoform X1 [Cucumis melo var. makuwa]|uniref:Protein PRD1 isoform X1 n=1 Tax=Cucumis melo var. makuwa TaxID=1194695 RepID=A0A5D3BTV9_CUCMM|nr:protein PRD1 isoform X1 [Cucumis melo var. makuwa]